MAGDKILVTGGRGFIGGHLVDYLRRDGWRVRTLDVSPVAGNTDDLRGDIRELGDMRAAMEGCEGVIHLAAVSRERAGRESPLECMETNVLGTANVLESARHSPMRPWVILGSTRDVPNESYVARSVYGASWLAAEICARRYAEDYGLPVLVLRLSDVYGSPRDHQGKVLPTLVRRAMAGVGAAIEDTGQQFDFTWYEDVLNAFLLGVARVKHGRRAIFEVATICTGRAVGFPELTDVVWRTTGACLPSSLNALGVYRDNVTRTPIWNDPAPAEKLLGFRATVSLEEGMRRMVESVRLAEAKA